jgi:hypothetical protein
VRDAEGDETTPSFGHPSNIRRGEGGKGLLSNLPISILIGGKGGAPRPEAQSARSTPSLLKTFFNIIIILRLFLLKNNA